MYFNKFFVWGVPQGYYSFQTMVQVQKYVIHFGDMTLICWHLDKWHVAFRLTGNGLDNSTFLLVVESTALAHAGAIVS